MKDRGRGAGKQCRSREYLDMMKKKKQQRTEDSEGSDLSWIIGYRVLMEEKK